MLIDLGGNGSGGALPLQLGLLIQKAMTDAGSKKASKTGAFWDQTRTAGYLRGLFAAGLEKPLGTAQFPLLARAFAISPIDRTILAARQAQMRRIARLETPTSRNVGLTVKHIHEDDPNFNTSSDSMRDKKMEAIELLRKACNDKVHPGGFTNWMVANVEPHLKYDRVAMVKNRNYKGQVRSYHCIDGTTVRPVVEILLPEAFKVAEQKKDGQTSMRAMILMESYQWRMEALEQLSHLYGMDFTTAAHVQTINGLPMEVWREEEMSILIANQNTELNRLYYGTSQFENSLELTDMFLTLWQYNKGQFNQEYPENLLVLNGDYDEDALEAFKQQLKAAGRLQDKRLGIISADQSTGNAAQVAKLRDAPKDMAFTEMVQLIINLKCANYRLDPTIINFKDMGGGQVNFQQARTEEMRISEAKEEGLHGLVQIFADWVTEEIVKPSFPDFCLTAHNLDREDETTRTEVLTKSSWLTINEARQRNGEKPLPKDDKRGELLYTPEGVQLENFLFQMKAQEEAMKAQTGAGDGQSLNDMVAGPGGPAPPAGAQQAAPPGAAGPQDAAAPPDAQEAPAEDEDKDAGMFKSQSVPVRRAETLVFELELEAV